jgi:hypothetical protein
VLNVMPASLQPVKRTTLMANLGDSKSTEKALRQDGWLEVCPPCVMLLVHALEERTSLTNDETSSIIGGRE